MCLRRSTTDNEGNSAVSGLKRGNVTKPSKGEAFGVESLSAVQVIVLVVGGSSKIPARSRPLPWPYHQFCINRFYRDKFASALYAQSEE